MFSDITIESRGGSYSISFAPDLNELLNHPSALVVADGYFTSDTKLVGKSAYFVSATEENKSLQSVERICEFFQNYGLKRDGLVIAIGGGIIQDLVTLAASIYMRGVRWMYVPTTLLGMVDSCIGGKSSINTTGSKNLLGNIYPPQAIFIHTNFLKSLSQIELNCGLSEALKIAYCSGTESLSSFVELFNGGQIKDYGAVIHQSLLAKKWFIEVDEFDKNERLQLNFGHTFGHAIEKGSNFGIPHGIAVALGMKCALEFNNHLGRASNQSSSLDEVATWLIHSSLGALKVGEVSRRIALDAFRSDKKHSADYFSLVLPSDSSGVRDYKIKKSKSSEEEIMSAIDITLRSFDL